MLNEQVPPPVTPRPSKPARTRNPGQDPPMPPTPSPTYERLRHYIARRILGGGGDVTQFGTPPNASSRWWAPTAWWAA
jgi:hypothetical protein